MAQDDLILPKSHQMKRVEAENGGRLIEDILIDLIAQGKSHAEIGQALNVPGPTVSAWVGRLHLDRASLAKRIRELETECAS